MKKRIKQSKGFAMAELLAVSGVIMLLFSILFSNYLPLMAEYETRIDYNNVTAEYAGHYLRKIYKNAIDANGSQVRNTFSTYLTNESYKLLYKVTTNESGEKEVVTNLLCTNNEDEGRILTSDIDSTKCEKIVNAYGVNEVILTKYNLTTAKTGYTVSAGPLYDYIQYLPKYKSSIYDTANANDKKELYRFIIKTDEFGYATTPVDSNYVTPDDCFIGKTNSEGKITLTGYNFSASSGCPLFITLPNEEVSVKKPDGSGFTEPGIINRIGAGAFKNNTKILGMTYGEALEHIEDEAFLGATKLYKFTTEGISSGAIFSPKIKSVGARAFSNTSLSEVTIEAPSTTIFDTGAFSKNEYLKNVNIKGQTSLENGGDSFKSTGSSSPSSLFAESGKNSGSGILVDYGNLTVIPNNMFYKSYLNYTALRFYDTLNAGNVVPLKTIGENSYREVTVVTQSGNVTSVNDEVIIDDGNDDAIPEDDLTDINEDIDDPDDPGEPDDPDDPDEPDPDEPDEPDPDEPDEPDPDEPDEPDEPEIHEIVVEIPSTVTSIGAYAFQRTAIDILMFDVNDSTLKSSLSNIGFAAFADTGSKKDSTDIKKDLIIPNTTTTLNIGGGAFSNSNIKTLDFVDNNYSKIVLDGSYDGHFGGNLLESVTLNNRFCSDNKLTLGGKTFVGNQHGISLTLPNCSAVIQGNAFAESKIAGELIIPENITAINTRAFMSNPSLQSVVITNNSKLTSIGSRAFAGNTGLVSFEMPRNLTYLTTIGEKAFQGDNRLTSFTVPASVTSIGSSAFAGCTYLGNNPATTQLTDYSSTSGSSWCNAISSSTTCPVESQANDIMHVIYKDDNNNDQHKYIKKLAGGEN